MRAIDNLNIDVVMLGAHKLGVDPREVWHLDSCKQNGITIQYFGKNEKILNHRFGLDNRDEEKREISIVYEYIRNILKRKSFLLAILFMLTLITRKCAQLAMRNQYRDSLEKSTTKEIKYDKRKLFLNRLKELLDKFPFVKNISLILFIYLPINLEILIKIRAKDFRPKIIIANDYYTFFAALILKSEFQCKLVYDIQEFYKETDVNNTLMSRITIGFFEKKLIQRSDILMTVSESLRNILIKNYKVDEIMVVPNTPPKREINEAKIANLLAVTNLRRIPVYFQGNFFPGRGLEFLLECWKWTSVGHKFDLYLQGPNSRHKQEIIQYARKLDVLDRSVFFIEAVEPFAMATWITHNAAVGLIPYDDKNINNRIASPNKLGIFLSLGLPVLANQGLLEVEKVLMNSGGGLVYQSGSLESFSQNLFRLETSVARQEISACGREYFQNSFNWESFINPVIEKYQKIIQENV